MLLVLAHSYYENLAQKKLNENVIQFFEIAKEKFQY